jgi:ATP-dependent DNA helicase RecG
MAATAGRRSGRPAGGRTGHHAVPAEAAAQDPRVFVASPVGQSGIDGAAVLRRLGARLDIRTVRDLLFHLPRRYDDLREMRQLGDLVWVAEGTVVSARVRVAEIHVEASFRRRVQRTVARLEDETGTVDATWFGRRYIERRLRAGDTVIVSGKLKRFGRKLTLDNPEFQHERADADLLNVGRIVPVYGLTAGLTAARLRLAVRSALDRGGNRYPEYLPPRVAESERLVGIGRALEEAHYPSTFESRDAALRRLAFDELLALQLGMVGRRRQRGGSATIAIATPTEVDEVVRGSIETALAGSLGRAVDLTPDQAAAIEAIRGDVAAATPMLRLIQGDVGSGKTAVAAYALAVTALAGRQAALLAPTDLLARQHTATIGSLLDAAGLPVTLLTGSLPGEARRKAYEAIADGRAGVVIGTHALIAEAVAFADLALVVIDEQHRFGVAQRAGLEAKAGGRPPHVLLMTATPIPRTLGQVLYADLDVSDLRTPPAGRIPIRTGIRRSDDLDGTWQRVRQEAAAGRRTFVVVPLIDEGEGAAPGGADASAPAAEAEAARLSELLRPLRVGVVHGRLKPVDRDATMSDFRDGRLDVLVGTTVVEVGVDVPEATMMIIEGADRFGLAQLHQLRGRVGRGRAESFCVLVSDSTDATAQARLRAIAELRDGFELAEKDWELRGEGNVLGLVQSGLPRLRVATLTRSEDRGLARDARSVAEALLDPEGRFGPGTEALVEELEHGWLEPVWAGDDPGGAA